jgi:pyroglutamyl-peptidase
VPLLPRPGTALRQGNSRITLEALVDAGEAMLMELVKLTRQAGNSASHRG